MPWSDIAWFVVLIAIVAWERRSFKKTIEDGANSLLEIEVGSKKYWIVERGCKWKRDWVNEQSD